MTHLSRDAVSLQGSAGGEKGGLKGIRAISLMG